jgi:hypothetical protein
MCRREGLFGSQVQKWCSDRSPFGPKGFDLRNLFDFGLKFLQRHCYLPLLESAMPAQGVVQTLNRNSTQISAQKEKLPKK